MTEAGLDVRRDGDVLRVTLARPERHNAFDAALIAALADAFADVGDARCVVLAGEGRSFCAGADVEWQRASIDLSFDENVEDAMRLYRMLEAIDVVPGTRRGSRPGLRARRRLGARRLLRHRGRGSRCGLRLLRGAARDHPGGHLARSCSRGSGPARRGATSSRASASTRRRRCASASCTRSPTISTAAVDAVVEALLQGGPEAVRAAKQLVREHPTGEATAQIAARRRTSEEGQDGLRAFLDKRRPRWLADVTALRRLLVLCGAIVVCDTMFFAALTPLLPEYADEFGLSKTGAGVLQAAYPLGVLVGSIPSGYVAARFGVKPTAIAALLVIAGTSVDLRLRRLDRRARHRALPPGRRRARSRGRPRSPG